VSGGGGWHGPVLAGRGLLGVLGWYSDPKCGRMRVIKPALIQMIWRCAGVASRELAALRPGAGKVLCSV